MATWNITFSRHNNTSQVQMQASRQPSHEEAAIHLLVWAAEHLKRGEYGNPRDAVAGPAGQLLRDYGVTITGIVEDASTPDAPSG